jgi:hypothetical protein
MIDLLAGSAHAVREPPAADTAEVLQDAAAEVSSQFLSILQAMLGGGGKGGDKTLAELAQHAPSNMSLLVDGVERVGLHSAIADPGFEVCASRGVHHAAASGRAARDALLLPRSHTLPR